MVSRRSLVVAGFGVRPSRTANSKFKAREPFVAAELSLTCPPRTTSRRIRRSSSVEEYSRSLIFMGA